MEPLLVLLLGAMVLFLAAAVQGLAGFGSALIIVPLMVLFMEPRTVIPLALLQGTFMNSLLFLTRARSTRMGKVLPLFISAALGLPLGTILLLTVGSDLLKVAIGAVIIVTSILLLFLRPRSRETGLPATVAIGLTSGVLNGAISMSGPPVVLAFQREGMGKERFRANLAGYFLALNLLTLLLFASTGVLTMDVWGLSLVLLPATALGVLTGMVSAGRFKEGHFRYVVLMIAAVSGVLSFIAGIRALMV